MCDFPVLHPTGLLHGIMHIIIISNPKALIFGKIVPGWHVYNSMLSDIQLFIYL